jgi:S-adenosylmethionine-dependent methyltransferase
MAQPRSFEEGAREYAEYMQTPLGRLRIELAWANLADRLAESRLPGRRAIDLGCGPGHLGIRLACAGWSVTLIDGAPAMIDLAAGRARAEGVIDRIELRQADALSVPDLFRPASFDLIVCHNVLEFVSNPATLLDGVAMVARRDALLSLLTRNRAGEALKAAVANRDLDEAGAALAAEWVTEPLCGQRARVFEPDELRGLLAAAGFHVAEERGVRVITDYLAPDLIDSDAGYQQAFDLERRLGGRSDFTAIARYLQVFAYRV